MDDIPIQKISPKLASLLAAAAGWALSSDVGKVGQMTDSQRMEWERMLRRNLGKEEDMEDIHKSLQDWWTEAYDLQKDHAPVPPIMGEVFDAVKHRWTKPENVGHTVTEVQGKKRVRGTGAGVHEHSVGGHGAGKARLMEAGRRYKSPADKGRLRFHDHPPAKTPSTATERAEAKEKKHKDTFKRPLKPS